MSPLLVLATALAADPLVAPNASVWVTDAMKAARSLQESTERSPKNLLTVAEKTNWQETGSYDECIALYRAIAAASPYAKLLDIGETPAGRRLYVLVASRDKTFTPEAARKTGKPILLIQNGIHPGENGGKDASVMLLRDMLVTKKHAAFLDKVIVLSIPVFNVDGHENVSPYNRINEQGPREMGFRVTAQRYNLNRDYMKADAPETRAWLRMWNAWQPDLFIDNHVTDGSDLQHDITIAVEDSLSVHPEVGKWARNTWVPRMWKGMEENGHLPGWYVGGPARSGGNFIREAYLPRFATGYAAARNRAALLVETHSLKPFRVRAWCHYDVMVESLKVLADSGDTLRRATTAADAARPARLPLEYAPAKETVPYTLKALETETYPGVLTGAPVTRYLPKAKDLEMKLVNDAVARTEVAVPKGYYIPRAWSAVADLIRAHGVAVESVRQPITADVEVARFSDVRFAPQPFEGRFLPSFETTHTKEKRTIPAGWFFVATNQPAGKIAVQLLEAQAPDGVVRWGLMNSIFEQKEYAAEYIMEPLARKMFDADPALKAEFEAALAKDPALARNPRARMLWFYKRTPFYEADKDVYPVLRLP